jgi:hypothetical protein
VHITAGLIDGDSTLSREFVKQTKRVSGFFEAVNVGSPPDASALSSSSYVTHL